MPTMLAAPLRNTVTSTRTASNFFSRLAKVHPLRNPDWRWDHVVDLVWYGRRAASRDDDLTTKAVKFLRAWSRADLAGRERLRARWTDMSLALGAYVDADLLAAQLEARLLARESDEVIARKVGVSIETVRIFESMFFNVRDRREAHDWLMMTAVGVVPGMSRLPSERDVWCYWALAGGPHIVDLLVDDVLNVSSERDHLLAEKARFLAREFAAGYSPQATADFLAEGRRLFGPPRRLAGGGIGGRELELDLRALRLTLKGKQIRRRRAVAEDVRCAKLEREKLAAEFWAKYGGIVTRPNRGAEENGSSPVAAASGRGGGPDTGTGPAAASGAEAVGREEFAKVKNETGNSVIEAARGVTEDADPGKDLEAEAILAAAMHAEPPDLPGMSCAGEETKLPRAAPVPSAHRVRRRANPPRRDTKRRAA
jgi:hypothetical protein